MATNLYPATFTAAEVCSKGDVSLVQGVFTLIGEYIVKADECVGIGRGVYSSLDTAIGRLFAKFKDTSSNDITAGKLQYYAGFITGYANRRETCISGCRFGTADCRRNNAVRALCAAV